VKRIDDLAVQRIAEYFQALSERTRLKLLFALRAGEKNVTQLVELCGCGQANVSKHLTQLTKAGFVLREMRGTSAYYRIADPEIFALCDVVSGKIADLLSAQVALQNVLRTVSERGRKLIAKRRKRV
jgi:DNA-binding transcriptional ArsR family regulator